MINMPKENYMSVYREENKSEKVKEGFPENTA